MKRAVLATITAAALTISVAACDSPGQSPTGSRTPTSSGSQPVPDPVIVESGAADLGIKWNWNLKPPLAFAEQVGWGETFFEVEWCALRAKPENTRYAQVERLVGQAEAMGYRMMLKIRVGDCGGGAEQVDPAEGTRKHPSTFPDDPAAYQSFVTNLVTRYSQRGVKIWAIENEVDANNFWKGTPAEYVELVRLAGEAITAADPKAVVLDAGISSTGYGIALAGELLDAGHPEDALSLYQRWFERRHGSGTARFPKVESVDALRTLLADGRAKRVRAMVAANWEAVNSGAVTAYQLHFYENPVLLPTLLDYIRRHLSTPLPVQGWEIGTAWPGEGYSEAEHGAETARLLGMLLREKVSPIVYLPLAYTPGGATKVEIFRGLVSPEGSVLPSGKVYAAVAAAAKESTAVRTITVDGGQGVLLEAPQHGLALVWPTEPDGQLTLDGEARVAQDPDRSVRGGAQRGGVLIAAPGDRDAAAEAVRQALGESASVD